MATFTTWAALQTQLLNDLASRDLSVGSYRAPDGRMVTYRTRAELQAAEGWVAAKAATEAAGPGRASRRVYCKPQGNAW
jgi:hypothetical protein